MLIGDARDRQADALAATRDLLLPRLVTGAIDVSHLDLDALLDAAGGVSPERFSEDELVERPARRAARGARLARRSTPTRSSSARAGRSGATAAATSCSDTGCGRAASSEPSSPRRGARGGRSRGLARPLRDGPDAREPGGPRAAARRRQGRLARRRRRGADRDGSRFVDWRDAGRQRLPRRRTSSGSSGRPYTRRCDIVCFVNGIPLVLLELKASHKTVEHAYDKNLRDYRDTIPQLFTPNALRDPLERLGDAGSGATFAPWERFGEWKRIDDEAEPGVVSLETAIRGTLRAGAAARHGRELRRLPRAPGRPDQGRSRRTTRCSGVNAAIAGAARIRATREGRLGVFWHTQGSGKSLSMLFFTQKVLRREPGNWTFVMVTDRSGARRPALRRVQGRRASSRATCRPTRRRTCAELLRRGPPLRLHADPQVPARARASEMPVCSEREDVIVITDEAHRSQYDDARAEHARGAAERRLPRASPARR